jgi:hypothetical protein
MPTTDEEFEELCKTETNGMIFEFKDMDQAKAFAAAVKKRFHLEGRAFDDALAAGRAHVYPFAQNPPVVHIDRPWWFVDREKMSKKAFDKAWDKAFKKEDQVERLALKFGGTYAGN